MYVVYTCMCVNCVAVCIKCLVVCRCVYFVFDCLIQSEHVSSATHERLGDNVARLPFSPCALDAPTALRNHAFVL